MQRHEILRTLKAKKISVASIAEALDVDRQSVYGVIRLGNGSMRVARAVAHLMDKPLEKVFPYYSKRDENKEKQENKKQIEVEQVRAKLSQIECEERA